MVQVNKDVCLRLSQEMEFMRKQKKRLSLRIGSRKVTPHTRTITDIKIFTELFVFNQVS